MHTQSQPPLSIPGRGHTSYGPPAYGPPGYAPVYVPPNTSQPQKSQIGLMLGIGAGAFVLVATIVGGGAYAYSKRSRPVALPVDATLLPTQTNEVATQLIEATRETDEQVRRAYLAAELGSELCQPGSGDPARRIEELGSRTPREAKDIFLDSKKREEIAKLLECGSVLGATLDSPYQTAISFEDEDGKKLRVGVGHFTLTGAPKSQGFLPQSYRGLPGFCRTGEKDNDCDEKDYGAFASNKSWFFGTKTALDGFAANVRKPKEKPGPRVESLKEAAAQTEGLPVVRMQASPKSAKEFFTTPCFYGAIHSAAPLTKFLDGCFPSKQVEKSLAEIDSKLKAAAYEMDDDHQKAKAFHGNIVFVAKDDRAAKDVEHDAKDIVNEWSAHLEDNEAKLINDSRKLATTSQQKKFGAVADAFFHALKKSKVTRKGRSVTISFREALSPEDLDALEEADRTTKAKRQATATIIDALQNRRPVPEAALSKIVGPTWGRYLASPPPAALARTPMTEGECRSVQARLAPISLGDRAFSTPESRSMFLAHKYATCSISPPETDPAQRSCLSTFRNAAEYALCAGSASAAAEPATSEYGDASKRY